MVLTFVSLWFQYGIKKKEVEKPPEELMDAGQSLTRKKKTQAEMAAEMNPDEEEDESSKFSTLCCCLGFL
jgi:hypothetical protein